MFGITKYWARSGTVIPWIPMEPGTVLTLKRTLILLRVRLTLKLPSRRNGPQNCKGFQTSPS